jgi:SAM-dependent methyltransferase
LRSAAASGHRRSRSRGAAGGEIHRHRHRQRFPRDGQGPRGRGRDRNVEFRHADLYSLAGSLATFDHVFVCFVLEHLSKPAKALRVMRSMLKPGGSITVIEGDHGSAFFAPDSHAARAVIDCLVELQRRAGGDAMIGRRLFPLLTAAGYASVSVRPLFVYADQSRPDLVDAFTVRTFTAMVEGVRDAAVAAGL